MENLSRKSKSTMHRFHSPSISRLLERLWSPWAKWTILQACFEKTGTLFCRTTIQYIFGTSNLQNDQTLREYLKLLRDYHPQLFGAPQNSSHNEIHTLSNIYSLGCSVTIIVIGWLVVFTSKNDFYLLTTHSFELFDDVAYPSKYPPISMLNWVFECNSNHNVMFMWTVHNSMLLHLSISNIVSM